MIIPESSYLRGGNIAYIIVQPNISSLSNTGASLREAFWQASPLISHYSLLARLGKGACVFSCSLHPNLCIDCVGRASHLALLFAANNSFPPRKKRCTKFSLRCIFALYCYTICNHVTYVYENWKKIVSLFVVLLFLCLADKFHIKVIFQ